MASGRELGRMMRTGLDSSSEGSEDVAYPMYRDRIWSPKGERRLPAGSEPPGFPEFASVSQERGREPGYHLPCQRNVA